MSRVKNNEKLVEFPVEYLNEFVEWRSDLDRYGFSVNVFRYSRSGGLQSVLCEKNGRVQEITPEIKDLICRS